MPALGEADFEWFQPRVDVRVRWAPRVTPEREPFVAALSRDLGVDLATAARVLREAPIVVKTGIDEPAAQRLRAKLEALGAVVEVLARGDSSAASDSLAPSADQPRLLPPSTRFALSGRWIALGVALAIGAVWFGFARWLQHSGDERMLGNTPMQESRAAAARYGLSGQGLADGDRGDRANWTLVVAWRAGCLDDDYRAYLEELQDRRSGRLEIIGAALAPDDARIADWPHAECAPRFRLLPAEQSWVRDSIAEPATYLFDSHGTVVAVWRGGMSAEQRARLSAWIDGTAYVPLT